MRSLQRLWQHLQLFIKNVQSLWRRVQSLARDPVKIWELALKVVLNLDSHLFILPLTLSTNQDGKRRVRIPTSKCRRLMPCILNAIFAIRIGFFVSITFDNHFRWLIEGQFTVDASAFIILILVTLAGLAVHFTFLEHKEDFAFLCNSVLHLNTAFSCTSQLFVYHHVMSIWFSLFDWFVVITAKHCGIRDIMYVGDNKSILAAGAIGGLYLITVPFTVFFCIFASRGSPLMIPYHASGGNEKLGGEGSVWYWALLVAEWALMTAGVLGLGGPAAIVCDAVCKIKVITRTLRSSGAKLSWEEKRSYHVQLEILMNTVQAIMGKLLPLMLMGASALCAISSALAIHLHNLKSGQICVSCAYLVLSFFTCLSSIGAFLLCRYIENIGEESAAVLKEIETGIVLETTVGSWVHGGRGVRRSLPARLFRRRVMRVKLGTFTNIETGFALEFLLQTVDNIVTFVFMVNVSNELWLF